MSRLPSAALVVACGVLAVAAMMVLVNAIALGMLPLAIVFARAGGRS